MAGFCCAGRPQLEQGLTNPSGLASAASHCSQVPSQMFSFKLSSFKAQRRRQQQTPPQKTTGNSRNQVLIQGFTTCIHNYRLIIDTIQPSPLLSRLCVYELLSMPSKHFMFSLKSQIRCWWSQNFEEEQPVIFFSQQLPESNYGLVWFG